ncbi:hypothetical protein PIB30_015965, partial [Stylosanthes scabra]|nr:hypothetical protein [Stylosanthes scabra]
SVAVAGEPFCHHQASSPPVFSEATGITTRFFLPPFLHSRFLRPAASSVPLCLLPSPKTAAAVEFSVENRTGQNQAKPNRTEPDRAQPS